MEWKSYNDRIEIRLPITTPTGKVRVKRPAAGKASEPVACRSRPMAAGDYLEWQISYDTDDLQNPSAVPAVVLQKKSGPRYGCELVRLMTEVRRLGLLPAHRWQTLRTLLNAQLDSDGIEEREQITVAAAPPDTLANPLGFNRTFHQVPDYLKVAPQYAVEIKIGPKQRAVGTQAMIYAHLPVQCCTGGAAPLPGRTATEKEKVTYTISVLNADFIYDTVLAFVLASRAHARDIDLIFQALGL